MSPEPCNVLISSAGRRVGLVRAFRSAIESLGLKGNVVGIDTSPRAAALHEVDASSLVPRCDRPEFVDAVLEVCEREKVSLVVPTIDPELAVYASNIDRFTASGVTVLSSSPDTVRISADKRSSVEWFERNGVPTVRSAAAADVLADASSWSFPLILKPAQGSSSEGVMTVDDVDALRALAREPDLVVQERAPGVEYTTDVLVNRSGRSLCAVPRLRLQVRGGEVSKAVTRRHRAVQAVAADIGERLPGAFGPLTIQMFADDATGRISVIEINPRFGGGFPLSDRAGAHFPRWILEELRGLPSTATSDGWQDGLLMLRYDDAVYVDEGECR
jgi:carbamoyl-phosphate synthase large subunit